MKDNYIKTPQIQKILRFACTLLVAGALLTSCSKNDSPDPQPANQYLTASTPVATVSLSDIKQRAGLLGGVAQYGIKAFRLTYNTVTTDNKPIVASGLVLFPDGFSDSLTVLSFQHGTITTQDEAPSEYKPAGNMEAYLGGTLGASLGKGYFIVMPDYLGFGESKSISHPYQHKATLASASLDMLRAAREFASGQGLKLKKAIRLAGYSEGGYTTMALHQSIEQKASGEFSVAASYPGAGPYDMVGTAQWVVSQNKEIPAAAATYYTWVLISYNSVYGINAPLTSMLTAANAASITAAIAAGTPLSAKLDTNPALLFTPEFIAGIKNATNTAYINAFKDNNVYDWKPKAPITLFHAQGDDIVPVLNSQTALTTLKANGANVTYVPLGTAATTHAEGAQLYLAYMVTLLVN